MHMSIKQYFRSFFVHSNSRVYRTKLFVLRYNSTDIFPLGERFRFNRFCSYFYCLRRSQISTATAVSGFRPTQISCYCLRSSHATEVPDAENFFEKIPCHSGGNRRSGGSLDSCIVFAGSCFLFCVHLSSFLWPDERKRQSGRRGYVMRTKGVDRPTSIKRADLGHVSSLSDFFCSGWSFFTCIRIREVTKSRAMQSEMHC